MQKIVNHLLINGKKNTSENILLKTFKELQKLSPKNSVQLSKLALLHLLPVLRVNRFSQKRKRRKKIREVPSVILNESNRISKAIKFVLFFDKKKQSNCFFLRLTDEILSNSQHKSSAIELKNNYQKIALEKKNIFKYYQKQ